MATPHARGSTLPIGNGFHLRNGYPACAGIDPSAGRYLGICSRLPRMRGDRPVSGFPKVEVCPATPHARGSTSYPQFSPPCVFGYPACAGIDRPVGQARKKEEWLPRMRGDRPEGHPPAVKPRTATPHARGSTPRRLWPVPQSLGYPACAGIDPCIIFTAGLYRRLPRMRGDRPFAESRCAKVKPATPHARGSTSD